MKCYIIDYETKLSENGGDYHKVYMANEDENYREVYTFVYPQQGNGKKIHNSDNWIACLNSNYGIALDGLKYFNKSKGLINADSINKVTDIEEFPTKQDMFDYLDKHI